MEQYKLEITLDQREWERLQKLSERNGEPMERIAARFLAADMAKIFNRPPDEPLSDEVKTLSGLYRNNTDLSRFEERYLINAYSKHHNQ